MNETITSAHSSRSRRTVAILTWIGLVIAAALLWRGRLTGAMRTDSSEVAAILLAAYTTFASIFAWMLFSPSRHASEDSLSLFFSGGLTLIPTCIIAFCLMPPDSPLRGWLTAGVCLITIIAVMSPIPTEFFGVPRERSSYFRPISEAMFENVEMRYLIDGFDYLKDQVPDAKSAVLTHSPLVETAIPGTIARDPWQDPFRGTDVRPAQVETQAKPPVRQPPVSQPPVVTRQHQELERPQASAPAPAPVSAPIRVTPPPIPVTPVAPVTQAPPAPIGFVTPTLPAPNTVVPVPPKSTPAPQKAAPISTPAKIDESEYDSAFEDWTSHDGPAERDADHDSNETEEADSTHDRLDDEPLKFERVQDGLGGEMIEGTIRVVFEPGQKRANLHVPFSPPLKGIPEVECEPVGGDDLRLKVPVKQPYGIRIEARRSDASARLETEIGFAAICSRNKK